MSLLGFEGFDGWITATSSTLYTNANAILQWNVAISGLEAGTLGGKRIILNTGQTTIGAFATQTEIVVGFRYQFSTAAAREVVSFRDSAAAIQCGLSINASGNLIFWRGTSATILATGTSTLVLNSDYFIEIKVQFANSANVTVKVDGVAEPNLTLTGVDTTNTANQNCGSFAFIGTTATKYDDVYLLNTSGGAPLNDFLGIVRVETGFPTANDSVTWTPNASTNVSRVQETTLDSDTTYNSTTIAANVDTFAHGTLSSTPVTIFAVKVQSFARKDDVSVRTYRNKLISGATTSNGTTQTLNTTYQMMEDLYTTDPDTAAAWITANANATKIGYEMVT